MARWIRVLEAAMPEDLSSVLETHVVEGEQNKVK